MAGSASDIALASNAMILLGGSQIASFTEQSTESQIAANLFEHSYKTVLSSHRWRFAVKQVALARLVASPAALFDYQYQLPTDLLYLIRTINNENYEIYGDKLYTNSEAITIEYVCDIPSDRIPSYFAKAMEYYLASQFAVPLTGDLDKASYYDDKYLKAIIKAKTIDSSARPSAELDLGRYTRVRRSNY